MKLKKIALNALGALMSVALVAGMLTSCSKGSSGKLVENIPASAVFVVKLNPQQVVENAGCTVENGKIVLSDTYTDAIRNINPSAVTMANSFLSMTEGLDLSSIMLFATESKQLSDFAMVAGVNDAETVKKNVESLLGSGSEEDGFTIFKGAGDFVVAVNDNFIWAAENMRIINRHIEKAEEASLASKPALADVLTADDAFALVVSFPTFMDNYNYSIAEIKEELIDEDVPANIADKIVDVLNYNLCVSSKLDGNTSYGQFYLVDDNGNRNEFGKILNEIDPSFLENIPQNADQVMAMGSLADEDLRGLISEEADRLRGRQYHTEEVAVLDFLMAWNGTAALGFDCSGFVNDISELMSMREDELLQKIITEIKMVAMVQLSSDMKQTYTDSFLSMLNAANQSYSAVADNYYSIDVPEAGVTAYFGDKNGYLTVGNCDGEGASGLASQFAGNRAVIYSNMGVNPVAAQFGWDFGAEGYLRLTNDAIESKMTLTNTSLNFLQAYLEPLTDMENLQKFMEFIEGIERNMNGRYNNYHYDYDYNDDYDYAADSAWVEPDYMY